MKILVIDNNIDLDCWGSRDLCREVTQLSNTNTVYVRRGPQQDLPSSVRSFDRIIVSGSKSSAFENKPWVEDLMAYMKKAIDAQIPLLGICFGHQILARALSGTLNCLGKAKTPEFGWTEIQIQQDSNLTAGLPKNFYSFSAHFEEVTQLPQGTRTLAQSKNCQIQAFEVEGARAFGLQFHPEKPREEGLRILQQRKKLGSPRHLFLDRRGESLYDPTVGKIIFENFLKL